MPFPRNEWEMRQFVHVVDGIHIIQFGLIEDARLVPFLRRQHITHILNLFRPDPVWRVPLLNFGRHFSVYHFNLQPWIDHISPEELRLGVDFIDDNVRCFGERVGILTLGWDVGQLFIFGYLLKRGIDFRREPGIGRGGLMLTRLQWQALTSIYPSHLTWDDVRTWALQTNSDYMGTASA